MRCAMGEEAQPQLAVTPATPDFVDEVLRLLEAHTAGLTEALRFSPLLDFDSGSRMSV